MENLEIQGNVGKKSQGKMTLSPKRVNRFDIKSHREW